MIAVSVDRTLLRQIWSADPGDSGCLKGGRLSKGERHRSAADVSYELRLVRGL